MKRQPASLQGRALQWLAQREHSRQEMRDKLLRLCRQQAREQAFQQARPQADEAVADARRPPGRRFASGVGLDAESTGEEDARHDAPHHAEDSAEPDVSAPVRAVEVEVEAVLVWLEANGHLSESRFTESRVNARQARFGHRRIQQELKQHGVALSVDASQALAQTEYARASELWRRRYGDVAPDAAGRLRQARFLAGRGFSLDVVQRLVRHGCNGPTDNTDD